MSDFWKQRRVMVTGATGLLGSWMTRELIAQGAEVTCLVRDWVPRSLLVTSGDYDKVQVVRGELEDHATVLRGLNEYEIDTVFHLGAQTIVGTATRSAMSTFEANIRGTWSLLEACRANKLVKRVVIASSDKAYGEHAELPYTEELPLQGTFPYDASKACTELIARAEPVSAHDGAPAAGSSDELLAALEPPAPGIRLRDVDPSARRGGSASLSLCSRLCRRV